MLISTSMIWPSLRRCRVSNRSVPLAITKKGILVSDKTVVPIQNGKVPAQYKGDNKETSFLISPLLAAMKKEAEKQKTDDDFLTALKYGMPPAGGMGLGIDRLIMLLTGAVFGKGAVRDVIEKKVASYLDKTASLSQILDEIHRLIGDPENEAAKN